MAIRLQEDGLSPTAGLRLSATIEPSNYHTQQRSDMTKPKLVTIGTLASPKTNKGLTKKRKPTKLEREQHEAQRIEASNRSLRKYHTLARLQGCICEHCKAHLYKTPIHPADRKPFSPLRGLQWRSHDAWHLATTLSTQLQNTSTSPDLLQCWNHLKQQIPFNSHRSYPTPKLFTPKVLSDLIDLFSETFFASQLPASKILILWQNLSSTPQNFYGQTHPAPHTSLRPAILLNSNNVEMLISPNRVIRVILHEMLHAFFGLYVCYPWHHTRMACAKGDCGKSWVGNLGATGHGRAWRVFARSIEGLLGELGVEGGLGCEDGVKAEVLAGERRVGGGCWRENRGLEDLGRGVEGRTKDDDEVMRWGMVLRRRAMGLRKREKARGRRGSF